MTPPAMSAGSPFALSLSRRAPRLRAIVPANLLKTSRNLLVISDSCRSVAEKLLLGLRMDAIRSQLARNRPATERAPQRGPQSPLRRPAPSPARISTATASPSPARADISTGAATVFPARGRSCLAYHLGPGPRM